MTADLQSDFFGAISAAERQQFLKTMRAQRRAEMLNIIREKISQQDIEWLLGSDEMMREFILCLLFSNAVQERESAMMLLIDLVALSDRFDARLWQHLLDTAVYELDNNLNIGISPQVKDTVRKYYHRDRDHTSPRYAEVRDLYDSIPPSLRIAQEDYLRHKIQMLVALGGDRSAKLPVDEIESALSLVADYAPSQLLAEFYLELAKVYLCHHVTDRGIATAQKSCSLFRMLHDHYGACMALLVQADMFVLHRQWEKANRLLEQAQMHHEHIANRSIPRVAFTRASVLYSQKNYAESVHWYEVALQQYAMHPEYQGNSRAVHARAACLQGMALSRIFTGEHDQSEREFIEAFALWTALNMPFQMAHSLLQRANLEYARLNFERAHAFMEEAKSIGETIADERSRAALFDEIRIVTQDMEKRSSYA